MRTLYTIFLAVLCIAMMNTMAWTATYTWKIDGSGAWTTATNWAPDRTMLVNDDILVINGASTP